MARIPTPLPPSLWSDGARRVAAVIATLGIAAIGFGLGYLVFDGDERPSTPAPTTIGGTGNEDEGAEHAIGGTRNTTRFAGTDPVATATAVATATHPTDAERPAAVVLAPADSWQLALAATPLVAEPLGAPILLSGADEVPAATEAAIDSLQPTGLEQRGTQAIAVGDVASDEGLETDTIESSDPAEVAAEVDAARAELADERHPEHLLVVSSEEPGYAMPAAAWAAHSGDPILFSGAEELPRATLETVARHPDAPVYVLGPKEAISPSVVEQLREVAPSVTRISAEEPVSNAIAFARFADSSFGWNINDPGHGFAIASLAEPIDAPIAAPLAALGKPGPLLVTTDSQAIPAALQEFLAETQPGYIDEPTRAIYNHVWIIGGPALISEDFQRQVDTLTNLVQIGADGGEEDEGAGSDDRGGNRR